MKKTKIIKNCRRCKEKFTTYKSEVGRGGGKYCSKKCYYDSRNGTKASQQTRKKMSISIRKALAIRAVSTENRFLKYIEKDKDGCWNWIGGLLHNGYGAFTGEKRKSVRAHRFSYEMYKEKIPKGLTIDHLCRNKRCVNPEHLEAVTMRVNVLRGSSFAAKNARKDHCLRGHDITKKENYYVTKFGGRQCKECTKIRHINSKSIETLMMEMRTK